MRLTNIQKAKIGMWAREAWDAWEGREDFLAANPEYSPSKCFEIWRRHEQHQAVGIHSLTDANQDQFNALKSHFKLIAGEGGEALKARQRAEEDPRIRAFHKLTQALEERGLDLAYAESICKTQYRRPLANASEKQLWNLFYTVRNRRKKIRAARGRYIQNDLGDLSVAGARRAKPVTTSEDPF